MTMFFDVTAALDAHLNTLPTPPPIAWPNQDYLPVEGTAYLSVDYAPANTATTTFGGTEKLSGTYVILIYTPTGEYKAEALTLADTIAGHFNSSRTLTYNSRKVRIRTISVSNAIREGAWWVIPLRIDYDCHSKR